MKIARICIRESRRPANIVTKRSRQIPRDLRSRNNNLRLSLRRWHLMEIDCRYTSAISRVEIIVPEIKFTKQTEGDDGDRSAAKRLLPFPFEVRLVGTRSKDVINELVVL